MSSNARFWKLRTWLGKVSFIFERKAYKLSASVTKAKENIGILGTFAWIGIKSLLGIILCLATLIFIETYIRSNFSLLPILDPEDKKFNIEQLKLYAQLLTTIYSIYFATIGIILSAGYTKLRRDIIQMLTNEQVGSVYSRVLVLAAMFCLTATAIPMFGYEPGLFVYITGTILTLLSALTLFPLGQRLFNFFDLNLLVRSEILPYIAHHIEGAANRKNSISLANHHSRAARQALEQLSYIDDRVKAGKEGLRDNLPALTDDYTDLLLHYLHRKHTIDQDSYWFPRRNSHKQWFFAGDIVTSTALKTSSQQPLTEEIVVHHWLENEIATRLLGHIQLAFQVGNFDLALTLISRSSKRISAYATQFQFEAGMHELKRLQYVIEQAFASSNVVDDNEMVKIKIQIADTWAAFVSHLCLETLRRMMTFEKELNEFFEADEWSEQSLSRLPAYMQVELSFIVERIKFEQDIDGQRLSKPKYIQQLAVQKLLLHYVKVLPAICKVYKDLIPDFVKLLIKFKMSEAATQVALASLHSHWKLPRWFDDLSELMDRYHKYEHYNEEHYKLPIISTADIIKQLVSARDEMISQLGSGAMVEHIFETKHNDELPDHFGQVYFELAEACISALEQNDENKLDKVLPMFMSLAFLAADSKFLDPSLDINSEFRLHLISTVINDLASVLGFAILYGAYFDNEKLSERAIAKFNSWVDRATDKQQYLKRMVLLSNPSSFSLSASPRGIIRINWKMSFEHRARHDGFGDQMGMKQGITHSNKIVREFLRTNSDVSHLFFAKQIVPQLDPLDFKIDYHISRLSRSLYEESEEGFA